MIDSLVQNENVSSFSISTYMTDLILPKCTIVHGEILTSVYMQIALHINNEKNVSLWKKGSCWMSSNTISNNIGCNIRTVKKSLSILSDLQLIEEGTKGKLKIYKLKNHLINTQNQLDSFNKNIEQKLLTYTPKNKQQITKNKFKELNNIFPIKKEMLKKLWIIDINKLRQNIILSEQIYKGSTLFYLKNIAPYINKENTLHKDSESIRAIKCGCSQSTISRYINAYIEKGFIQVDECKINKPITFKIKDEKNNNCEGVVNNMTDVNFLCPICQRTFLDQRSLGVHISKSKDMKHKLLNNLKKQTNTPGKDLVKLYKEYESDFKDLDSTNSKNSIAFNDQDDSFNIIVKDTKAKPEKQKKEKTNSLEFVKYFYNKVNGKCTNYSKECTQVKNALKKGYTADQIKITMDYLARKGNIDLRFFNRSIEEALMEHKCLNEINIEGTEAYLVKMYYNGLGLPLNMQTFTRDVQRIRETINTGLSYEQTKIVIQYMVDIKCPTLNFIGSKSTEALTKHSKVNAGRNNPCFYDREEMQSIKNQLMEGKLTLRKVSSIHRNKATEIAKEIFRNGEFALKYNHYEWAWKIGLELDEEMYVIALNNAHTRESLLDKFLKNPALDSAKRQAIMELKNKFNIWLNNLDKKYAKINVNNY